MLTLGVCVYRLTDTQFKLDALDKDPYALDSLARPLPFRGEHTHTHQTHIIKLNLYPISYKLWPEGAVGQRFARLCTH